jgi:lysozyme
MTPIKQKLMAGLLSISVAGLAFTSYWESGNKVYTEAYLDVVGVPTICDGITRGVTLGMKVTPDKCHVLLEQEMSISGEAINKYVQVHITQGQYDVLSDFIHHFGETKFRSSTLLQKINVEDCKGAGEEFLRWNKARVKGKLQVLRGLQDRANARKKIWMEGCGK